VYPPPRRLAARVLQAGGALAFAALAAAPPTAPEPAATPPAPHRVPDTLAQRVQACTPCHGAQGVATRDGYFPRIAGKPAGYLYQQLLHFREGRRPNPAMARLLENLSDAYLQEIAAHFAALDLPHEPVPPQAAAPREVARGAALVRDGDAVRGLPACVACHGAALTGVAPAVPGLLGLPRDYLIAQLGAWRTGLRRAHAPDCMADLARRLPDADIAAVATYLAQQPMPRDARPAASLPAPMPVDCGSVPR
jgi:cytochrome c553